MTKIKPWLLLALIFVVGIVTGSALTILLRPHFVPRSPAAGQMKDRLMAHLTQKLNLTEDQQTKIKPILSDAVDKGQVVHHEEVARMTQIMEAANQQIATILTPDQQAQLQKMVAEDREFASHRHHGGGPNGPPPPDH